MATQSKFLQDCIAVASGSHHSLALKRDGTVWAWGENHYGQLGNSPVPFHKFPIQVPITDVIDIAAGYLHSLAIRKDGTVWAWGLNIRGQLGNKEANAKFSHIPVQVMMSDGCPLTNVKAIAGGGLHSMALKNDGTVCTWGMDISSKNNTEDYKLVPFPDGTVIVNIATGAVHSLAVDSNGIVWGWGGHEHGQLGIGADLCEKYPALQIGFTDAIAVAVGTVHSLILKRDGTVWTCGTNYSGLGNGVNVESNIPVQVSLPKGIIITAIAGGADYSIALDSNGGVWTWGLNKYGQLGNSANVNSNVPVQVSFADKAVITNISAGSYHSLALRDDGTVLAWGGNYGNTPIQVVCSET
jgi:alpha-tubulin suppressor-like RCC1 family protein